MLKVTPLFSGSRGNSTLIQTEHTNILLDAGYGFRSLVARLAENCLYPRDISAIVVTHEHSDHISALKSWAKYFSSPVFVPQGAATFVAQTCYCPNVQPVLGSFDVADVHIDIYRCSHDARECFGYKFSTEKSSVASVTDTGVATAELVSFLSDCQTVVLESNHDLQMLQNGSYPAYLKRRIASDFGHLSNAQAVDVLRRLVGTGVKQVVLAHLSEQNNTKQIALKAATEMYSRQNVAVGKDVKIYVADQYKNEVTL